MIEQNAAQLSSNINPQAAQFAEMLSQNPNLCPGMSSANRGGWRFGFENAPGGGIGGYGGYEWRR